MIDFFETIRGVKGVVKIEGNKILSIICQGVPGTRVEGRNFLLEISKNMINSDVVRFEPRGMGYSEGNFMDLTHNSWLDDIADVLYEMINNNNSYTIIRVILMSDAAKMIINLVENVLKKLNKNIKWQIILINGILTKEYISGPNKTRIVKIDSLNWGLYTGFGVFFSLDFLNYYPNKYKVRDILSKNKKNIFGIYGTEDDLTMKFKLLLKSIGIKCYEINKGDHLFTNNNNVAKVLQAIREIYTNYE